MVTSAIKIELTLTGMLHFHPHAEADHFGTFKTVCALHRIADIGEAMEWGKFRSGGITIADTGFSLIS